MNELEAPQFYPVEQRIYLIKKFMDEGFNFYEIGNIFGGVGAQTINYHWRRYGLGEKIKKKNLKKQKDVYKEYITELSKAGLI